VSENVELKQVSLKMEKSIVDLIDKIVKKMGIDRTGFIRMSVLTELARRSYLDEDAKKALGITSEPIAIPTSPELVKAVPVSTPPARPVCPRCGAISSTLRAKFCGQCGADLRKEMRKKELIRLLKEIEEDIRNAGEDDYVDLEEAFEDDVEG